MNAFEALNYCSITARVVVMDETGILYVKNKLDPINTKLASKLKDYDLCIINATDALSVLLRVYKKH